MDQLDIDAARHAHALRSLQRINVLSRTAGLVWKPLASILQHAGTPRPARILDIATGGGDIPIALWRRARRAGLSVAVHGCDMHPHAIRYAQQAATRRHAEVEFFVHDIEKAGIPEGYDIILCTLFLHHLPVEAVEATLRGMAQRARVVIVNDLIRSGAHLALAYAACHTLTRSDVVHFDGPASVRASFTTAEIKDLAARAGMHNYTLSRHWPFRWRMVWTAP